ncbi:MAG: hypothetical protein ACRCY8_14290, partial [Dermatophilaceae bacterium]
MPETLVRWAEFASLGRAEHRRRIMELVGTSHEGDQPAEPVLTPEDSSYLEECLGHPERVKYVTESARGAGWLSWVAARPELGHLFANATPIDSDALQVADSICWWVADHFLAVKSESPAALRVMRDRPWSLATTAIITHRLLAQDGVPPAWQTPWLLLALQQTPPGRNELLDTLLGKENWRERPDLALHLFEHRIRPILVPG